MILKTLLKHAPPSPFNDIIKSHDLRYNRIELQGYEGECSLKSRDYSCIVCNEFMVIVDAFSIREFLKDKEQSPFLLFHNEYYGKTCNEIIMEKALR